MPRPRVRPRTSPSATTWSVRPPGRGRPSRAGTVSWGRCVADRLRQVEHDAAHSRVALQEGDEQRSVSAPNVDDQIVTTPLDGLEPIEAVLPALPHRAVEGSALLRMRRQPRPELAAVDAGE